MKERIVNWKFSIGVRWGSYAYMKLELLQLPEVRVAACLDGATYLQGLIGDRMQGRKGAMFAHVYFV